MAKVERTPAQAAPDENPQPLGCGFFSLDLTHEEADLIKEALKDWLDEAEYTLASSALSESYAAKLQFKVELANTLLRRI